MASASPFLVPGTTSSADRLAIIHLKRDLQVPTILRDHDEDDDGYAEGKVLNTRFGSFPHSTLIGLPWGSQVRASVVDTGSRGRVMKGKRSREESMTPQASEKKRPRSTGAAMLDDNEEEEISTPITTETKEERENKEAVVASSGFVHLLPPTPENWTSSLPHRTQVVYTPDYSYILHRIRARPGVSLIEAGAGSGSFTHASARAVYSGYPSEATEATEPAAKKRKLGKVWSYEFHEQRHQKLTKEVEDHGLNGIVHLTHRDVCAEGFLVGDSNKESPKAEAIFLDLPAPWLALPHLSRSKAAEPGLENGDSLESARQYISPLNPRTTVHICTFSPCIEQVQRTVSVMRQLGWVDIEMVEVMHKKLDIRRDQMGVEKGVVQAPASVDEAVARLAEIEGTFKTFHQSAKPEKDEIERQGRERKEKRAALAHQERHTNPNSRARILESLVDGKAYQEGRLVHRTEPEVKTHTSYLVFAVLPREWTAADEDKARAKWPMLNGMEGEAEGASMKGSKKTNWPASVKQDDAAPMSRRQMKKVARMARLEEEAKALEKGKGYVEGEGSVNRQKNENTAAQADAKTEVGLAVSQSMDVEMGES